MNIFRQFAIFIFKDIISVLVVINIYDMSLENIKKNEENSNTRSELSHLPDEFNLQKINEKIEKELINVEGEYQMGGLSSGLYAEYATEVTKRTLSWYKENLVKELELRIKILSEEKNELAEAEAKGLLLFRSKLKEEVI